jgi:hypothetical protein
MKKHMAILLLLFIAATCVLATTNSAMVAQMRPIQPYATNITVRAVSVVYGDHTNTISSADELNRYVTSLPKGTRLIYGAGYAQFFIPVGTNRIDLRTFGAYCKSNDIHFTDYVPDF